MEASTNLEYGDLHPLDESAGDPVDWAHQAARGIAAYQQDVPEINAVLEAMDEAARADYVAALAEIIREAQAQSETMVTVDEADAEEVDA